MTDKKTKNEEIEKKELDIDENSNIQEEEQESKENIIEALEKLKEENNKYYEHLQRTAAEFDNYKKRVQKEKESIYSLATGDVISKYIPILDNLEKALNAETQDEKMKEGIMLIHKQMLDIMNSLNVEAIPTINETFNPEIHDAVMHVENEEYGEKVVIEELRKGYKMGERVIRHAMVKVAN